jgi:hypothetical protein
MAIQPQSFLSFTARNYPLLLDIYRREIGVNEAELYELIRKYPNIEVRIRPMQ